MDSPRDTFIPVLKTGKWPDTEMKIIPGWDEGHPGVKLIPGWNNSCKRRLTLLAKHQCSPLIEKKYCIIKNCKMSTNLMHRLLTMTSFAKARGMVTKPWTDCSALLSGFRIYLGWSVCWSDTERKALLDFLAVNLLRIMPNITDNASVWVRQLVKGWESVLMISGLPLIHKLNMEIKWK